MLTESNVKKYLVRGRPLGSARTYRETSAESVRRGGRDFRGLRTSCDLHVRRALGRDLGASRDSLQTPAAQYSSLS